MYLTTKNRWFSLAACLLIGVLALGTLAPAAAMTEDELRSLGKAPSATEAVKPAKSDGPNMLQMVARMVIALGVVFGLMVAVLWAARRWMPKTVTQLRGGPIEILANRSLGQRRSLLLVRAKDKTIFVGRYGPSHSIPDRSRPRCRRLATGRPASGHRRAAGFGFLAGHDQLGERPMIASPRPHLRRLALVAFLLTALTLAGASGYAQAAGPSLTLSLGGGAPVGERGQVAAALQLIALLTVLSLAPAILIMMTSFTRIVVVLGFVRRALATQEVPPTQIIIGLSLFLTFFVMAPTWIQVHQQAIQPYFKNEISMQEALTRAVGPHARVPIQKHAQERPGALCPRCRGSSSRKPKRTSPCMCWFLRLSSASCRRPFLIGFIIYIPFLIIDMVVSSILLSMGMMMLPPVIVSLPFKIILFVLVDGWNLIIGSLVRSFT